MPQNSKTLNDITESDLIKALQDALEGLPDTEPGTITMREYADAAALSDYKARKQLATLCDEGLLERRYVARINAWGDRQAVKGYRYVGSVNGSDNK